MSPSPSNRLVLLWGSSVKSRICHWDSNVAYILKSLYLKQKLDGIQSWMTSKESHQHCNAFSLVMICDGTEDGQLFDCQGETFSSIKELTDKIVNIQTLKKKPKLILIKRCNGNNITYFKLFNNNWYYSYSSY